MRFHSTATSFFCLCLAILPNWASAQALSSNATPAELSAKVQIRLDEARNELGLWVNSQANPTNPPAGATAGETIEYRAVLDSWSGLTSNMRATSPASKPPASVLLKPNKLRRPGPGLLSLLHTRF